MSSFSLHISTDTAAFGTDDACPELARILRATADKIERAGTTDGTTVRDINGNTVGRFFWTERYATHDDAAALDRIAALLGDMRDVDIAAIASTIGLTGREIAPPA